MSSVWTGIIFVLNLYVSGVDAYYAGYNWAEAKKAGGWPQVVVWSAAIMAACGFTWCNLTCLAFVAGFAGYLTPDEVGALLNAGYLVIIIPCIGTGLALWANSAAHAWRDPNPRGSLTFGYNTAAMAYDVSSANTNIPNALGDVSRTFADGKIGKKIKGVLILLVLIALFAGILTTVLIIKYSAKRRLRSTLATPKGARVNQECAVGPPSQAVKPGEAGQDNYLREKPSDAESYGKEAREEAILVWVVRVILGLDVASQWKLALSLYSSLHGGLGYLAFCILFLVAPFVAALLLLMKGSMVKWGLLLAAGLAFIVLFQYAFLGNPLGSWMIPLNLALMIAAYRAQRGHTYAETR